ncbi:YheC/YheD family endospore coat-associated protein [Bacillus sp. T33-2]|uniref:YheC/YheD family endospore coat-associated protein n=1 Tax=Bacillus sp. T33-2 TaxID=2054168 RepID=UPI000C76CB1E|nr:YheC/YheD family protein [Bacillus sp. T33-2]PLR89939.1 glutathione synthetase [Bacillus sp. T33-2]
MSAFLPFKLTPNEISGNGHCCVWMRKETMLRLGIKGMHVAICAGKSNVNAEILPADIPADQILFSTRLFSELRLPVKDYKFLVRFSEESNSLSFGPVIAVLTEITGETVPSFRSIHSFCEELHDGISGNAGFFYVFSLQHFSDECISGYYYEQENWKMDSLPFPDIVYNRIHSRKAESTKGFAQFAQKLNERKIHLFNHRFLSKWEVHELLEVEGYLGPYLPSTCLYTPEHLEHMLELYDDLYLKPVQGSQGRRIIRILKKDNQICADFSSTKDRSQFIFTDIASAISKVKTNINDKPFIIQHGIELLELDGRRLDFRVLCHKTREHMWKVSSVVARIAAENHFVSNVAQGGEMIRPLKVLSMAFGPDSAPHQLALIKELALEAAGIISKSSGGLTGELGIDIGADISGRLWIIEVNSKPSKSFEEKRSPIRPSAKAIINFCNGLYTIS